MGPRRFRAQSLGVGDSTRVFGEVAGTDASLDVSDENTGSSGVGALTAAALDEIRQLKRPATPIRRTLEVVHLVLHANRHSAGVPAGGVRWERVLRMLASDDFTQRLQDFDIAELRRHPALARGINEVYFGGPRAACGASTNSGGVVVRNTIRRRHTAGEEALRPERVLRASSAAATLFSWAARTVQQVAAEIEAPPAPVLLPVLVPSPEPPVLEDEEPEPRTPSPQMFISVAVWATCPGEHGLEVGCAARSPVCNVCGQAIVRGNDSAACRECGYFVCVECRRGAWVKAAAFDDIDAGSDRVSGIGSPISCDSTRSATRRFTAQVRAFRFLRREEDPPHPCSLEALASSGAAAWWNSQGSAAAVLGSSPQLTFDLRLDMLAARTKNDGDGGQIVLQAHVSRASRSSPARKRTSCFGLADAKGLSCDVLALLRLPATAPAATT
eukprot:TRINITY_DN45498_c0_g1_i1.p1 TRINITY_DN45498_c0_g1~~TRINITY_DN45498_c0_g1_i1.p1  ORF type:complete len:443 (+),score=65.25 TRINITY_DN45498_c0_g1_i1:68-1396(+)